MFARVAVAAALLAGTLCGVPAYSAEDHVMQSPEVPVAMDFLAALGRKDFDAAGQMLDDDAVLELPFAGEGLTVKGRPEIVQFLRRSMGNSVAAIAYKLDRAYPSPEAGALVLEVSTQGQAASGRAYTNRLVTIFAFRRGKIVLFREYFNPAPLAR